MDFIYSDLIRVIMVTNKVPVQSNLYIIKNYIKNINNIDSLNMEVPQLPQSKSYLKIIGISYLNGISQ